MHGDKIVHGKVFAKNNIWRVLNMNVIQDGESKKVSGTVSAIGHPEISFGNLLAQAPDCTGGLTIFKKSGHQVICFLNKEGALKLAEFIRQQFGG